MLSAFPLIVGPVLLVAAQRHGTAFAAQTAAATLLGLIALSGFALAYGRSARRLGWRSSLAFAWLAAAALGALAGRVETGLLGGLVAATGSLAITLWALPPGAVCGGVLPWELPLRMALTAVLIVGISAAAGRFGPPWPVRWRRCPPSPRCWQCRRTRTTGPRRRSTCSAACSEAWPLRDFCALIGLLVEPAGVAAAFVLATAAAVLVQAGLGRQVASRAVAVPQAVASSRSVALSTPARALWARS